jgi:hypothetical protein
LDNGDVFGSKIDSQTITIEGLHTETRALVEREAKKTRADIVDAIKASKLVGVEYQHNDNSVTSHHPPASAEDLQTQDIILQTLRFPTMNDRYEAIEDAHAKTCNWIFEELDGDEKQWDSFSRWLQSSDSIYWISGKAGSGKSTLMHYISKDPRLWNRLRTWASERRDLVTGTFFFWISGTHDQASQVGLLRSLLFTLLGSRRHLIAATFPDLWLNLSSSISRVTYAQTYNWTLSKLKNGFRRLFSQDVGHVFLLIDGLDEYQGDPAGLIDIIHSIISPKVKICLSSRPWQIFEDAFRETPKLRLQNLTFGDISRYVNEVLWSDKKMRDLWASNQEEALKLIDEIVAKADGVFLWVTLVVKSFLCGLTNRDKISNLRKRLEEIPPKIEDLYTYMLSKIEPIYHEERSQIFSTVALAYQGKSGGDGDGICAVHLSFAIEDDYDLTGPAKILSQEEVVRRVHWIDARLKVCCAGLLELHSSGPRHFYQNDCPFTDFGNRQIRYIHRTARDFLATREFQITPIGKYQSTTFHPAISLMRSNILFVKHCIKYNKEDWYRQKLESIFKRTMWLAHRAERETGLVQAEVLDEFERVMINFKRLLPLSNNNGVSCTKFWSSLMPTALKWQFVDYLSVIISWGLNLYLERKLVSVENSGKPYLDCLLRMPQSTLLRGWDVKTVSILLAHGGNPNFAYNHGAPGEKLSTPWQAMLLEIWKKGQGRAIDSTYQNDVSGKNIFTIPEILGQLFELLLRNGADPHAKSAPLYNHQSKHLESFSISDVIKKLFKEHPDERARLLVLLKDLEVAEAPPMQPPKVQHRRGRISRLAAKLSSSAPKGQNSSRYENG